MNDVEAATANRALELAEEFAQHSAELRGMARDLDDWRSLRELLPNVTGAIRTSDKDEMVRHNAFSLVVAAFDPRGETGLSSE
jgi:hypothetical protein